MPTDRCQSDSWGEPSAVMTRPADKVFVFYVPALDRRRVSADVTPFLHGVLRRYPCVRMRTQPTTELVPSLITGAWPHQHRTWQVSLRPELSRGVRLRLADRLPDWLTTTAQCLRHVIDPEYDLAAVPYWRRRRLRQHRFKYTRRRKRGADAMRVFGEVPSLFELLAGRSRFLFCESFARLSAMLPSLPAGDTDLELLEYYGFDLLSHWNLDDEARVRRALGALDVAVARVHAQCQQRGVTLVLLVDHGQERIRGTVDIKRALHSGGVRRDEFTYFVEVAGARVWFHSERARERIMTALGALPHVTALTYEQMHDYDVRFEDNRFADVYVFADHGRIFFPHDFYQPLANLYLSLRNAEQRARMFDARHRGSHGHLPDHPSEEGYVAVLDGRYRARADRVEIVDFAPTVLAMLGEEPPDSMAGRPAFLLDADRADARP